MAKASDIKIVQSTPIVPVNTQTNSTTTGTQNTVPVSTNNTVVKKPINTDPLWKQALKSAKNVTDTWDRTIEQTKADVKREWES
jgi:hypothetical protein